MMKYPIGIQDFGKLRTEGYLYIDKTRLVYELVQTGSYYFLSRPRRFGKSLLLSTLEAYLSGRRELFHGLDIECLETEWTAYPILHIDLNTGKYTSEEALQAVLNNVLSLFEETYGASPSETTPELRFQGIIRRAAEQAGCPVVILIDEYDKPMLQAIGNEDLLNEYRAVLKAFYSVLKTQDRYIKFAFLTGVTKFGKVSVFSDLNNLEDLSMLNRWSELCGITEREIHAYLEEEIDALARANGLTAEETCRRLQRAYDGYHFCENSVGIYNPFSLLNTFKNRAFGDYWFETGTPTFLVELLKKAEYDLNNLSSEEQTADMLNSIDSMNTDPIPIIYQSGYLTVKGYDEEFRQYRLGFPNEEVERGFNRYLLPFYAPLGERKSEFAVNQFVTDIRKGNTESFLERLKAFFADGNYEVMGRMELYFQNVMYVIFKIMGFYVEVEKRTARGRVDVVLKTADYIYVIEVKRDGSADEALRQIDEKGYAEPFRKDGRKLFRIGINFSSEKKTVDGYRVLEG